MIPGTNRPIRNVGLTMGPEPLSAVGCCNKNPINQVVYKQQFCKGQKHSDHSTMTKRRKKNTLKGFRDKASQ